MRQHITLSPDGRVVIVAVGGARTRQIAEAANAAFLKFYADHPTGLVLFDTSSAHSDAPAEEVVDWATDLCLRVPRLRVAILTRHLDCRYARMWRRALAATGHEATVFDRAGQAVAWLGSPVEGETLYID
jgi:hypothetical protein